MGEFAELASWLCPPRKALTTEEILRHALQMKEAGLDSKVIQSTISSLQQIPAGRPHKRLRYVEVFDLMLQSPEMSLGKAIRKLNPHLTTDELVEQRLEKNIKAGIVQLKKRLRKYAPDLVTRYEALHPDRAKLRGLSHNSEVNG
jgi:hypothetical protein